MDQEQDAKWLPWSEASFLAPEPNVNEDSHFQRRRDDGGPPDYAAGSFFFHVRG